MPEPGTFVRLSTDPGRSGVVQPGDRNLAGTRMVPVQFANGSVAWLPEQNLEPVASAPPDLTERFAAGRFVGPDWLRRTLTRIRVTGRLSDMIYSMEATDTDFYAFQFKPVLKLLNSPTDALLIADEVGLGKTIEAGLIWTELRARLESNRLVVICPRTLCEKWRLELEHRFGVNAQIVDAQGLSNLLLERGRRKLDFAAVASMQALRPPKGWDAEDEQDQPVRGAARRSLALALSDASDDEPLIDLLVVDEAHHMRNPHTLLYRLGELVNAISAHRVFLSATPIHLRSRDLYSLLRLIDPDTFEYESTLRDLIETNEPIVETRDLLLRSNVSREDILQRLATASQLSPLAGSKALRLLCDDVAATTRSFDMARRAELASRLEGINQLANYVTRTRRRDVEELRVVRDAKAPLLQMHEHEREFYQSVTSEVARYAMERGVNAHFLLSSPLRMLTSSPAAASRYWAEVRGTDEEEIEETDEASTADSHPMLDRLSSLARDLNATAKLEEVDTKFELLESELQAHWHSEPSAKVVIFSSFKPTLGYLLRRLRAAGVECELIHGSVTEPRQAILSRFQRDPRARVLLSSEVGSEGIDLQFCWTVVNYDLPWNPMRVEQRIGRVDRLGQESPKVMILNLIYEHTIDATIYERLYKRLGLVTRALGEFETILGEPIRQMTTRLLEPGLTEKQCAEVVDQAATALEFRRQSEEELERTAGALIRHGDYVLQRIRESREHHRWLSGSDILVYVKDRLSRSFPGCEIECAPAGADTYRIVLSENARRVFTNFVAARGMRGMTRAVENDNRQRYRFVSSVVQRRDRHVECVSQLHPLVRFVVDLDAKDESVHDAQPVTASVRRDRLGVDCDAGIYVVGIRRQEVRQVGGRFNGDTHIAYAGAALEGQKMLSSDTAEELVSAAARHGRVLVNFVHDGRLGPAVELLRRHVTPELDQGYEDFLLRTNANVDDRCTLRERALKRHREVKAESLEGQRDSLRAAAAREKEKGEVRRSSRLAALALATEARLGKLNERVDARLREIEGERNFAPEWTDVGCVVVEVKTHEKEETTSDADSRATKESAGVRHVPWRLDRGGPRAFGAFG